MGLPFNIQQSFYWQYSLNTQKSHEGLTPTRGLRWRWRWLNPKRELSWCCDKERTYEFCAKFDRNAKNLQAETSCFVAQGNIALTKEYWWICKVPDQRE